jgi:hypothetical protein
MRFGITIGYSGATLAVVLAALCELAALLPLHALLPLIRAARSEGG